MTRSRRDRAEIVRQRRDDGQLMFEGSADCSMIAPVRVISLPVETKNGAVALKFSPDKVVSRSSVVGPSTPRAGRVEGDNVARGGRGWGRSSSRRCSSVV